MRVRIRRSKLASYSRRLGSIALPVLVLSIIMHRSQSILTETFHLIISIAFFIAALALISGIIALVQLWFSGDKGWSRALTGVFLGVICLTPLAYASIEAQRYPNVSDVSTNPELNLKLFSNIQTINNQEPLNQQELVAIFPNMVARNYQINADALYQLVLQQINLRHWEIIKTQEFSQSSAQSSSMSAQINAIDMSLFGWRDEIAILIIQRPHGSSITMRSASKLAKNDLGVNGKRIEKFLVDLDEAVTKYSSNLIGSEPPPTPAMQSNN